MSKLLPVVLVATALLLGRAENQNLAIAATCAGASCPPPPLGFVPGQRIDVEVVNQTGVTVLLAEKVAGTDAIPIRPGQALRFRRWPATEPNFSLVFWSTISRILTARLSKPNPDTLRVVLISGGRIPGDRTIYILNDGRVMLF
ncbi:hypothetical protein [Microseira sp. BLCC-F43]|jgi:hypothetical protein|uniref:hypothetical protein n=1 Tax=Microseira sp. BLCC-F43 TaxID=3153602 RepID=UPI0035BA92FE